jgi:hypothetical protein
MAPKGRSMGKMNASARHLTSPPSVLLFCRSGRGCSNACCLPQISVLSAGEQWLSLDNYAAVIRCLRLHTLGELILYSRHLMSLANRAIMQHFLCRPKGGPWSQIAPEYG